MVTDPIGALARLQLGRSYALSGDKTKAKTAYQDFLALWKDASQTPFQPSSSSWKMQSFGTLAVTFRFIAWAVIPGPPF